MTSSDEKVLIVDAQGQVTIKGTGFRRCKHHHGQREEIISAQTTPAERTITIDKGTLALTLTAVNRTTGAAAFERNSGNRGRGF